MVQCAWCYTLIAVEDRWVCPGKGATRPALGGAFGQTCLAYPRMGEGWTGARLQKALVGTGSVTY